MKSQSNGALMRCTPMVVWTSKLKSDEEIKKAIE
jgi:ADP-ribosylglycohydrolase